MTELKPWCWQASYDAKGPDWLLLARVTPSSIPTLAQIAATLQPESYVGFQEQHDNGPALTFMDSSNASAYQHNLNGKQVSNLWIYNLIQIGRDSVMVEAGYGGRGDAHARLETDVLVRLFTTPGIVLQHWQVLAGGNGYEYILLREGMDAASFMAYLRD